MNGYANNHLAERMAAARRRETERRVAEDLLLSAPETINPVRARLAHTLIRIGESLAPKMVELATPQRTSQPY